MTNRRYERTLIMLKPDTSGYSFDNKEPSGHSTIEIRSGKSRLMTYVQSLAPLKKHQVYRVYLIAADNSSALAVSCGAIPIGESAKAESRWEFDPDNVGGTGRAIEEFNIVAVLVRDISVGASGASKDIISPLVGYVDTQRVWKNLFTIFEKESSAVQTHSVQDDIRPACSQPTDDVSAAFVADVVVDIAIDTEADTNVVGAPDADVIIEADTNTAAIITPDIDTDLDSNTATITDAVNIITDNIEALADDSVDPSVEESDVNESAIDESDVNKYISKSISEPLEDPALDPADHPAYRFIKSYGIDSAAHISGDKPQHSEESDLTCISRGNPVMNPFIDHDTGHRWVRISLTDLAALPIDFWKYGNNAFMLSCYKKYRHYILGSYSGMHVFGIPCVYNHDLRQRASKLGFTRFKCCSGGPPQNGEYGYWLMDICE